MELRSYVKRLGLSLDIRSVNTTARQPCKHRPPPHQPPNRDFLAFTETTTPDQMSPHTPVNYTPQQLAKFYGFPTDATGVGTKIAVIELGGGYVQSDLDTYFTDLGLTVKPVVFHSIDGAKNSPTNSDSADAEVMLDLCIAGAMAPDTELHCYMAPNSEAGFLHAIEQAIEDKMTAISISWGAPERLWSKSSILAYNAAFQRAADLGITVTAAAGDSGSSDGLPGRNVDFPASSPLVLGCGGTSVPSLATASEIVWNDGGGIATGGGISALFAIPEYQKTVNVPGNTFRGVPDVAGNADPSTGWKVIIDGSYYVIGGTSAVSPMWAALAACLTQALGKNVGFLNSSLYALTNWSRDVLYGNNGTYSARAGYDCCTGMGVPVGVKLLTALQSTIPAPAPEPIQDPEIPEPIPTPPSPVVQEPDPTPPTTHIITITGMGTIIAIDGKKYNPSIFQ
jgi:kumamolisin